jgi:hypothetical protein
MEDPDKRIPKFAWFILSGTGPRPRQDVFGAKARRAVKNEKVEDLARVAYAAEQKAAYAAVEKKWGRRGTMPASKELRKWYEGYLASRDKKEESKDKKDGAGKDEPSLGDEASGAVDA